MESSVFLNSDGYVEMVLVGVQARPQLEQLINQARDLVDAHGPINLLVDARRGRIDRDAGSISTMLRIGRNPKLQQMVVLFIDDPSNPNIGQKTGFIISVITAALGLRPLYIEDEAEARAVAAGRQSR